MQATRLNGTNGAHSPARDPVKLDTTSSTSPSARKGKGRAIDPLPTTPEDEETFVYDGHDAATNGEDDQYEEHVSRVLEDDDQGPASPTYAEQLERVLGEPHAEPSSPVKLLVNGSARARPEVDVFRDSASTSTMSRSPPSPLVPHTVDPAQSLSSSFASSIGLGMPPRRPAMHPQISRLRSSMGGGHQRFPSASSYTTAHTRPGTRPFSPSSSQFDVLSRRSSASNVLDGPSPALSDLFSSPPSSIVNVSQQTSPVRWTPLKRLSARMVSPKPPLPKLGQPMISPLGRPITLAASGVICIGTDAGWTLVFDYSQTLRCICGTESIANEAGAVTALAISQDHTFVGVGHASGVIHLYSLATPHQPSRSVPATSLELVIAGRAEGHLLGSAICFIGFVGARHTAVVTADERGLAFAHSLGKVLGLANTDVVRILGRYPDEGPLSTRNKKPVPIWDVAPLPLGTRPHAADSHALVALITPAKLVLVGLKPKARTWWRAKPDEKAHDKRPVCGALAWQPNVEGSVDHPVLAFCWEQEVRLVTIVPAKDGNGIVVEDRASWTADGPVIGLQWVTARTLLLIFRTHFELFDVQLLQRTGRAPFELASLASIDSAPVSPLIGPQPASSLPVRNLRVYKAKIFTLSTSEVRVGTVLSWADRILHLVSSDNLVEAINLTTAFYRGEAHATTLGLPEEDDARHTIVSPKLDELLTASVEYVFSPDRMTDGTHDGGVDRTGLFESLVDASLRACLAVDRLDFVWDELFERFLENGIERIFLGRLEPFILLGRIRRPPTIVLQKLIAMHQDRSEVDTAEQIIWHVDADCLDLNQALSLCQRWRLLDALAYVYTRAMHDYVAPFVELLGVMRQIQQDRRNRPRLTFDGGAFLEDNIGDAYKVYAFLSQTLTGMVYPSQEPMTEAQAAGARADLYEFVFSGRSLVWPERGGRLVLTADEDGAPEPTYPYIRLLLRFDAEAALDALDAAFEDSYLNDGAGVDRQLMVNLLLEVMSPLSPDFTQADRTFLNIFVARNLPKYPQFVLLPPSTLHRILVGLTDDPDQSTLEDRQLAAEYLLSVYLPHDSDAMLDRFEAARFYRILRSVYRADSRWSALASVYLRDPDVGSDVFGHLSDLFTQATGPKQRVDELEQARDVVLEAVSQLASLDARATASLVARFLPDFHDDVVRRLDGARSRQYAYLRCLLDPTAWGETDDDALAAAPRPAALPELDEATQQLYVDLLCEYDSGAVIDFLGRQHRVNAETIEICERHEAFDAVVWSLDRNGETGAALDRFEGVIDTRGDLLRRAQLHDDDDGLSTYLAQSTAVARSACALAARRNSAEAAELAWTRILRSLVDLAEVAPEVTAPLLSETLASLVGGDVGPHGARISLSRLARRLFADSSGTYGAIRPLVDGLLAAQRSEAATLSAACELADRDRFDALADYASARDRGWSPSTFPSDALCLACGEPAWLIPSSTSTSTLTGGPPATPLFSPRRNGYESPASSFPDGTLGVAEHIDRLAQGSPERPRPTGRLVKRPSLKGKEPSEAPEELRRQQEAAERAAQRAAWRHAAGVVLARTGVVYHRGCYEAVQASEASAVAERERARENGYFGDQGPADDDDDDEGSSPGYEMR